MPIEVHLYGKLRRLARNRRTTAGSIVNLEYRAGDTIGRALARMGIALEETSNIFLNGELSAWTRLMDDGDRLGIFPDDMALLYSWYFVKKG
ncbi:MAG: MoaD/ThiS family protein [Dehalococcoidia bacterium]|nr:MoaD/ThiS family protein [Dehalococcoidia bacterium]